MIRLTAGNAKAVDFIIRDGAGTLVQNLPSATSIKFQVKRDRMDTLEEAVIRYISHPRTLGEVIYEGTDAPVPPGNLLNVPVIPGSVVISDGVETFNDIATPGVLAGSLGGTGTLAYDTGAYTLSFATPPVLDVEVIANYNQGLTPQINFDIPKTGWIRIYLQSTDTLLRPGDYYFALQAEWPTERVELTIGDGVLTIQQDTIR